MYILPSNVPTVPSASKLAQAKYVMTAFNSKGRQEISHNDTRFQNYVRLCHFAEDGKEMYKENARAQPLFCSLNLLH